MMDKKNEFTIIVVGDTCPWQSGTKVVVSGKSHDILRDIQPYLDDADLRLIQWETPLTHADTPIVKSGPNLKCPPETVDFIKKGRFDVALLANNHIGDYGTDVVLETHEILDRNCILHVGTGMNLEEAQKPLFIQKNNFRISIVNIAEHEYGTATKRSPGSAPLEPLVNIKTIRKAAKASDICLVVVHGGNEHNPVPSPRQVLTYRTFAEEGASAVINIHPHCPQGIEIWNGVPIVYSPGNFFFPSEGLEKEESREDKWWYGYLPKITFPKTGKTRIETIPYRQDFPDWKIVPLSNTDKAKFEEYLKRISAVIKDEDELEKYYDAWCAVNGYGKNIVADIIVSETHLEFELDDIGEIKKRIGLRNMNTCESHHDLMCRAYRMLEEFRMDSPEVIAYAKKIREFQNKL